MNGNNWRKGFFVLLACNLLVVGLLVVLINWPVKDQEMMYKKSKEKGIGIQVHTTRKELNHLIHQYLANEGLTGTFDYEVYITDSVELHGKMPFFDREVDLTVSFTPIAQKNGDILLQQKEISIGELNLPVTYVMNFINKRYQTPDWVTIQPEKQSIYVSLQDLKWKSDVRVKAKEFDLEHDDISFLLTVPSL